VIFADQAGQAHARRWTNRQSGRSAVSPATSTVLMWPRPCTRRGPDPSRAHRDPGRRIAAVWPTPQRTSHPPISASPGRLIRALQRAQPNADIRKHLQRATAPRPPPAARTRPPGPPGAARPAPGTGQPRPSRAGTRRSRRRPRPRRPGRSTGRAAGCTRLAANRCPPTCVVSHTCPGCRAPGACASGPPSRAQHTLRLQGQPGSAGPDVLGRLQSCRRRHGLIANARPRPGSIRSVSPGRAGPASPVVAGPVEHTVRPGVVQPPCRRPRLNSGSVRRAPRATDGPNETSRPGGGRAGRPRRPRWPVGVQERRCSSARQVHPRSTSARRSAGPAAWSSRASSCGLSRGTWSSDPCRTPMGTGVSLRQSALDPGFHCVPTRSTTRTVMLMVAL
jgi:hypothetical protein